jgi:hypothetical protein
VRADEDRHDAQHERAGDLLPGFGLAAGSAAAAAATTTASLTVTPSTATVVVGQTPPPLPASSYSNVTP